MIRVILWTSLWCLCLGFASIDVTYTDGLHIRLYSWAERKEKS